MNALATAELPQLDAPGAGLPWVELRIARVIFAVSNWRSTREKSGQLLVEEGERISNLVVLCSPERAAQRVLIKRLSGMEDSSRFWSVYMTLDHLRIVNLAVAGTIKALGRGEVPDLVANTASLKPDPTADSSALKAFLTSCALVERSAAQIPDLTATVRYAHPWFGPLNAAEWHFMAGFHMRLHRHQIQKILDQLPVS